MVKYCDNDVIILERVWKKLQKYVDPKTHLAVLHGGEKWHCPKCGQDSLGFNCKRVTKAGTIRIQMTCHRCNAFHTISNTDYGRFLQDRIDQKIKDNSV
mgnify:FL=1